MSEQWEQWIPAAGVLEIKYYVDAISDTLEDGFSILLSDEDDKNKIKMIFNHSIESYKKTEEHFRLRTFRHLSETYKGSFYSRWTFFKVLNSSYIKWLSEESHTLSDHLGELIHFSIIATDFVIDIVAHDEPEIEFIND